MDASLVRLVWERACDRCEYCLIPQGADVLPHHIDHIIAQQHGGETVAANLALACYACNLHKVQTWSAEIAKHELSYDFSTRVATNGTVTFAGRAPCLSGGPPSGERPSGRLGLIFRIASNFGKY
jgi:hypothetical protein